MKHTLFAFLLLLSIITISNATPWLFDGDYTRYSTNPVTDGEFGSIIQIGDTYYYYYAIGSLFTDIYAVTTTDFINWTDQGSVMSAGGGAWDDDVWCPVVINESGTYHMMYNGEFGGDEKVGLANSSDGITWTKYASNPVFDDSSEPFLSGGSEPFGWHKANATHYVLWYNNLGNPPRRAKAAYSTDMINWTPYNGSYITFNTSGTDHEYAHFMGYPLIYDSINYLCILQQNDSRDYGIFYVYNDTIDPFFDESNREFVDTILSINSTGWDSTDLDCSSFIVDTDNHVSVMLYSGYEATDGWQSGMAYKIDRKFDNASRWGYGILENWSDLTLSNSSYNVWDIGLNGSSSLETGQIDQHQTDHSAISATENSETHRDDILGNTFIAEKHTLTGVSIYLGISGSPPDTRAELWETDGHKLPCKLVATGDYRSASTGWNDYTIYYNGLDEGRTYFVGINLNESGGTLDASNYVARYGDNGQNLYSNGSWTYSTNNRVTWGSSATYDCSFKTYYGDYVNGTITLPSCHSDIGKKYTSLNITVTLPSNTSAKVHFGTGSTSPTRTSESELSNGENNITITTSGEYISVQIELNTTNTSITPSLDAFKVGYENAGVTNNISVLYYGLIRKSGINDQTFSQIAATISNDQAYSWYNSTSDSWESYWVGYSYNQNHNIPKNESYFVYTTTSTDIDITAASAGTIAIPMGWYMTYLRESAIHNLTTIKSDMGANVTNLYAWNITAQDWTDTGTFVVDPNGGLFLNCSQSFNWDGAVP